MRVRGLEWLVCYGAFLPDASARDLRAQFNLPIGLPDVLHDSSCQVHYNNPRELDRWLKSLGFTGNPASVSPGEDVELAEEKAPDAAHASEPTNTSRCRLQ